jgi:hypothetical protein
VAGAAAAGRQVSDEQAGIETSFANAAQCGQDRSSWMTGQHVHCAIGWQTKSHRYAGHGVPESKNRKMDALHVWRESIPRIRIMQLYDGVSIMLAKRYGGASGRRL